MAVTQLFDASKNDMFAKYPQQSFSFFSKYVENKDCYGVNEAAGGLDFSVRWKVVRCHRIRCGGEAALGPHK